MFVVLVILVSHVSIHVPMANTVCIVNKIVHVKMVPNAITSVARVNVHLDGWEQIAIFHVLMVHTDQIAVKIANAKIMHVVVKMMVIVFVVPAGWEIIAMMFVRKVSMDNIVWNFVNAHHQIMHVMQRMDVNVDKDMLEMIV